MIATLVFYVAAFVMVFSAFMVIVARNTARSAIFLALTFFCAAILWMLLNAEFLSLVIIFVYVGAVMTLFLFVVMMLNVDVDSLKSGMQRYFLVAVVAVVVVLALMIHVLSPHHLGLASTPVTHGPDYSNTAALGMLLYTKYLFSFEMASIILLIAIIGSISLVFVGRRQNTKGQKLSQQQAATKAGRLRIVKGVGKQGIDSAKPDEGE